ncbi:glycoside hydrolase family 25 protein [Afifella pfennigii]|uniref:glycoside hydrolase family 25 protein n=1 Tax=Afifella pfennigii TaxID=209897 RepID=UPI00068E2C1F|nr:glycoside hydrolase family 25 protein [Afifella pfennigii]
MLNAVIDISHYNGAVDLAAAKADGIIGVIQKATEGTGYVDPSYAANRDKARAAGLLWGAYHFGTGAGGAAQATHFLSVVGDDPATLLALDFEANPSGPSMSLEEAKAFIVAVARRRGRFPGFYSNARIADELGDHVDPLLARCWLWAARYGSAPVVPKTWPTWTMWQYTDGHAGPEPHAVAGVGPCDRDRFNGDEAGLRRLWGQGETAVAAASPSELLAHGCGPRGC